MMKFRILTPVLPVILIIVLSFSYYIYSSYENYMEHQQQQSVDLSLRIQNFITSSQKDNSELVSFFKNKWSFIDNVATRNQDYLLNETQPYVNSLDYELINIYDISGKLLVRADNPAIFGAKDKLSEHLHEIEKDKGIVQLAVEYGGKALIVSASRIDSNYGAVGYIVIGTFISSKILKKLYPEEGAVFSLQLGNKVIVSSDNNKVHIDDLRKIDISFSAENIGKSPLTGKLLYDISKIRNEFWSSLSLLSLFFISIGIVVVLISRKLEVLNNKLERTLRENAEKSLHASEQDLATTLDSIGDAVISTDAKGNIVRMNPVAQKLTGWSLEEAQGQSVKTVLPIVNASTREPIENPIDKVLATGETVYLSNHTTLIAKDGSEYQIADSAAPIRNGDNNIQGMVLVFNDVTEQYLLREAAAKSKRDLEAILDHSPALVYVKESTGRYIFINQHYENLFHVKRKDVIGFTDYDIFPKEFADNYRDNDKEVFDTGLAIESEEDAPQDDGLHTFHSIKFPLFDDNGNIYAVCGMSSDITERKLKDEQLRRSQKMDALGKLTGGIAHDYNNMLGVILGYSELIEEVAREQPELTDYINEIRHAGERGAKLTKKLLTFSRQQSSEDEIVNLNALLEGSQLMLEKTMTARISLKYELEKALWLVSLDVNDLEDAILNMSINAMHSIEGNGQVTFETRNEIISEIEASQLQMNAGEYVLFSITDNGCGMDNETKEKIFDPFFSTKGELGTGLGLSQVYGLVQRTKGNVKIYSELGQGSRFSLYFPRHYKKSEVEEKQPGKGDEIDLSGNQSILVVDDEPALAKLTSHILTQNGYRVFSANSGKEALLILAKEHIDLLLSDVIMPEMDGYQLAATVLEKHPNIKIQMASGFSDDRHVNNINSSLQQNLLHKPYHSKKLLLRIRELLNSSAD